jgi:hypothetical protein
MKTKTKWQKIRTGRDFEALSDAEKEQLYDQLDRESPAQRLARSRPLTRSEAAREREMRKAAKARMGRPVIGAGAKQVAVTLERGLLARADAYARQRGLKRSEMIARGLTLLMAS